MGAQTGEGIDWDRGRRLPEVKEPSVRIVDGDGDGDGGHSRQRPSLPNWIVVSAVIGIGAVFTAATQGSFDGDQIAGSTANFAIAPPLDDPTTTAAKPFSTGITNSVGALVVPAVNTGLSCERCSVTVLRGDVALTPRPGRTLALQSPMWVVRPGGSVVQRDDLPPFWPVDGSMHPFLLTGENIVFSDGAGGYIIDSGLVNEVSPFMSAGSVIPGATSGLVWFTGSALFGGNEIEWVAPVDVESGTAGDPIVVSDLFVSAVAGISDGIIVRPLDPEKYGRFAFWSPTEGLQTFDTQHPSGLDVVFVSAASGDVAVVRYPGILAVLNIANGDLLITFPIDFGFARVTAVCLSPDLRHLVVVASDGEAFIGDIGGGEVVKRLSGIQATNGVGWTANDQLVYVVKQPDATYLEAVDLGSDMQDRVAVLEGSAEWWLAASGAMC